MAREGGGQDEPIDPRIVREGKMRAWRADIKTRGHRDENGGATGAAVS